MKNFHFALPAGMFLSNMVLSIFVCLQLFDFLCFLFLLYIRQGNLHIKLRNTLLLNTGRVRVILIGGFSWFFQAKKGNRSLA